MSTAFAQAGPRKHSSADDGRQCPIRQIVLPLRQGVGELLWVPYPDARDALDALEEEERRHALKPLRPQENFSVKKNKQTQFAA